MVRPTARPPGRAAAPALPVEVAVLAGSVGALAALGLVMVLSASSVASLRTFGWSYHYVVWQTPAVLVGGAIAWWLSRIDYRRWRPLAGPLLLVALVLLFLVLLPSFGHGAYGSRRWLGPGAVRFQPSEFAKLALALWCAHASAGRLGERPGYLAAPAATALVAVGALVILEPDLGTTVVLAIVALAVVVAAGIPWRNIAVMLLGAAAAVGMLALVAPYRRDRLFGFLDPWSDASASGYQLVQSLLGLGSGGIAGVGLGASRQKWSFLPNAHTDFILAIVGEELGLVGTMLVILLFGALAWAGFRIAVRAPDAFGTLLAAGITAWLVGQALVNMGTVTGLLPVTGIPLPFVSYGVSQVVAALLGVGVLASVGRAAGRGG